jgi:AraC-like DNA-binding protein
MGREELVERYFTAWNNKDVSGLLKLMHPQASYYDAFWGEICSGSDLSKYFGTNFEIDTRWYKPDDEIVATPNGLIIRYAAFDCNDSEGLEPILNGAEVITLSDGLIMTISDFYCYPDSVELMEIAKLAENQNGRLNVAPLGLSARSSAHIKRRLSELANARTVFLDPALTVTRLADFVGCSVMHLFHVLEEEKQTSFLLFVDECRARYATTLLTDVPNDAIRIDQVAEQSGFESVEALNRAFHATFGVSGLEYAQQFSQ